MSDNSPGGTVVLEAPLIVKEYSAGGYDYLCEARPGATTTDAAWRITRFGTSTIDYAGLDFTAVAAEYTTETPPARATIFNIYSPTVIVNLQNAALRFEFFSFIKREKYH